MGCSCAGSAVLYILKPYIIRYLYAEVKPYADNKSLENKDKMPIIAGLM
jgi:hypothetical protein